MSGPETSHCQVVVSRIVTVLAALLALAGTPSAATAEALADLFDSITFQDVNVASPAVLDRVEVNPANGVPTGGRSIDSGFFTGRINTTGVLRDFANSAFGQLQNLPVASSVTAFAFNFDAATSVFRQDEKSLGPILSDRASTTGKGRFSIATSYQYAKFDEFEGQKLSSVPLDGQIERGRVFTGSDDFQNSDGFNSSFFSVLLDDSGATIPTDVDFPIAFPPTGVRDQTNSLRPDATSCSALGIPIDMLISGNACFFSIPGLTPGAFEVPAGSGNFVNANSQGLVTDGKAFLKVSAPEMEINLDLEVEIFNFAFTYGVLDDLDVSVAIPLIHIEAETRVSIATIDTGCDPLDDACNLAFFADVVNGLETLEGRQQERVQKAEESATGIGDIIVGAKYQVLESKYVDLAGRGRLVLPTGDEEDFLGARNWAGEVSIIASKTYGRFSGYLNAGTFVSEESHDSQVRYSVGSTVRLHDRFNVGVEFLGRNDVDRDGVGDEIYSVAPGFKANVWDRLVMTATAIVQINDQGLKSDVIPAVNLEYTFD